MRNENQEAFLRDDVPVIVATVAFGMGINKPNVRYVLHVDLPKNIESYYQETGRAGAMACRRIACCSSLGAMWRSMATSSTRWRMSRPHGCARQQLRQMADFAEFGGCRINSLLRYFGEHRDESNCGRCDNCLDVREEVDVTIECQKLLSCVFRINKLGPHMGLNHTVEVLRGSENAKVLARGHIRFRRTGSGRTSRRRIGRRWDGS